MTTSDRDGLSAVQITRINRIELARFRKAQADIETKYLMRDYAPGAVLLLGIFFLICLVLVLVGNHWSPGTELYTRLSANLDDQPPSITIYADQE